MAVRFNNDKDQAQTTTDFGAKVAEALSASQHNDYEVSHSRDGGDREDLGSIYDQVGSITSFLSGPLQVSQADQKLESIVKDIREIITNTTSADVKAFDIQSFDGSMIRTPWNSLIITHKEARGGRVDTISFAVLMIEADQELSPRTVQIGKDVLEMPLTAFDLYDQTYHDAVKQQIIRTVAGGDSTVNLRYSGTSMLPREYRNENDADARNLLMALGHQVVSTILDETLVIDDPTANLGGLIREKGYELVGSLNYPTTSIIGPDKLPIHADLVVSTRAQLPRDRDNRYGTGFSTSEPVVDVGMMIDLVQIDNPERNRRGRRSRYDERRETHQYMGNVIVTAIANPRGLVTLSTSLLALSTAMVGTTTEVFPELLKPGRSANAPLGDIGAIGYQIPDDQGNYGYIDVRGAEFTENGGEALYDLIYDAVAPDLMLSIDIPENILGSRAIKGFTRAADEDNDRRSAIARIGKTLNDLTDGVFGHIAPELGEIVEVNPLLVPMGYFHDANGQIRDLRELNFLAALNYAGTKGQSNFMDDWNESVVMADRQRGAALRIQLMREIVGYDNVHVKGFARRHSLDAAFVEAMAQATQDAGIAPTIGNLHGGERRRFQASFEHYRNYAISHTEADRYGSRARYNRRDNNRGFERRGTRFNGY